MSIKDLFNNDGSKELLKKQTLEQATEDIEGIDYLNAKIKEQNEFVPPIDFSTASNFAKFGSAELYYEYAFKRIYQQYPYDGTRAEKQQFENESSYLDKYIFENIYPRTNGYVNFGVNTSGGSLGSDGYYTGATNKEYIYFAGGPHSASNGMTGKALSDTFDLSTIHDPANKREDNLKFDLTIGNTIEFWLKKTDFDKTIAEKEVIFDLTNNLDKRVRLFLSASDTGSDPLYLELSGATTSVHSLGSATFITSSVADSNWHHYAISLVSNSSGVESKFYLDTVLNRQQTLASPAFSVMTSSHSGSTAALGAKIVNNVGDGQLISSSIDEFRFWKSARTSKEIGQNWFVPIGGGTDDSLDNVELGVYFKFNEGITTDATTDSIVLDYSGRLSNGSFVGYSSGNRNTGSAIVEAGVATSEYKDPIIYSFHPNVSSSMATYMFTGSMQDDENASLFYHYLPSWLVESDESTGKNVKFLNQIMASYFDTLHAQISFVNKIKDNKYFGPEIEKDRFDQSQTTTFSDQTKPYPFARQLLRHKGFVVPNLFVEANVVEEFLQHDVNEVYNRDINEIKNLIYQNLHNNILDIYKSKGTEKSFYRYLRNFGIDSSLVKLNLYADNSTYLLKDNYEFKAIETNAVNFNHTDNNSANVYQLNTVPFGNSYIEAENDRTGSAITIQFEAIIPTQPPVDSESYYDKQFKLSSIGGFHRIDTTSPAFNFHGTDTWMTLLVSSSANYEHSQFILTGSSGANAIRLTSSVIPNLYSEQKWNFGIKVNDSKFPFVGITGSDGQTSTNIEFYGVCSTNNKINNSFLAITSSTNYAEYLEHVKKFFVGADKTNFTGSAIYKSDVVVTDFKYWETRLENEEINQHSFNNNYGSSKIVTNDLVFSNENKDVGKKDLLAIHWSFLNNTTSSATGTFIVDDLSSGSMESDSVLLTKYGKFGKIANRMHRGVGHGFVTSSNKAFDKVYFSAAQQKNPNYVYSSDSITVKQNEKEFIFQDDEVSDNFYSFEKSMQATLSDEMFKMFADVTELHNLIGQVKDRYRPNYKDLEFVKRKFFEKIENYPNQEKFFEFYKWIDSSISYGIQQLYPASARFSPGILNIIESHVLERPKHHSKFPMLSPPQIEEGGMTGAPLALHNYMQGFAPVDGDEDKNCGWQKTRKEDSNSNEDQIRRVINSQTRSKTYKLRNADGSFYDLKEDLKVFRPKAYNFEAVQKNTIHSGINYQVNKNRELYKKYIQIHGPVSSLGVPQNVMVVGVGPGQGFEDEAVCLDPTNPLKKVKLKFDGVVGSLSNNVGTDAMDDEYSYEYKVKGQTYFPFNIVSSSVSGGYSDQINTKWKQGVSLVNLHSDTVDITNEIPVQTPYTEQHVGGRQSRHSTINRFDATKNSSQPNKLDSYLTRAEEWRIFT